MTQYNVAASQQPNNLASAQQQLQPQHKRVYQACIPCRRRKVRCDLGSVDNPHDPPCVRCRRESKECFFSATRRKRKTEEEGDDEEDLEEYIIRNGRKRHHLGGESVLDAIDNTSYNTLPLTPGTGGARGQQLRRSIGEREDGVKSSRTASFNDSGEDPNTQMENLEAQTVMRPSVYGPHDALNLLYKAATDAPHNVQNQAEAKSAATQPPPKTAVGRKSHLQDALNDRLAGRAPSRSADPIDPRLLRPDGTQEQEIEEKLDLSNEDGYAEALKAWSRFRFVRGGWFTKEEAVKYIAYYYEYLSPLTPISPPTFRSPASHITLLTEEPILAVTLLTIASRYYQLPGPGRYSRAVAIHDQLWTYLRKMIERCLWGQEAFGGGFFSGSDENWASSTAPWRGMRRGSLRTLGTIESLLILTEWHPRALHFPPEDVVDELMLPVPDLLPSKLEDDGNQPPRGEGRPIESWLEPAWRSDRMCWMLLSTAMGLAYELGVFDDIDELLAANAITRPEYEDESYRLRAMRIKRLLLIYSTQLAGRLGWTNLVPESIRKSDPALSRKRPHTSDGNTPGTNQSVMSNNFNYIPNIEQDDSIIHCWVTVSNAMQIGNEKLFRSRKHTTEIIQSGQYTQLLKDFQPILQDCQKDFERFDLPPFIRHILTIEFEYVRIYINSLALQAVVERSTNASGSHDPKPDGTTTNGVVQLSPQTQNYYGNLPLGQIGGFGVEDRRYVQEVVDGCRNLLRTVVDNLLPDGYLKHAPVRTYFRIISGAMFLLKTFALGAPKSDVVISIGLMDRIVDALRTCVVDDVHLGTRFADLLATLTRRLGERFKYAPSTMQGADGTSQTGGGNDSVKSNSVNGNAGPNPGDQAFTSHASKLREGLTAPERSSTPTILTATPFDVTAGTFPFPAAPAPAFVNPGGTGTTPGASGTVDSAMNGNEAFFDTNGTDWNNPDVEMWYLPTGPGLFQNVGENSNVSATDMGVAVNNMDLLEYMMDPMPFQGNMDTNSGF